MVRITVSSPTHRTSERLYGVFFEDINHSADGGLNANMVNNYSFDGVYLNHHTWRLSGADRWRTEADPLRFWRFTNCTAESYGSEIRGDHGQILTTHCPAPPVHAHSRYARISATLPAYSNATAQSSTAQSATQHSSSPMFIENLGYNGGGKNGSEPAFSIVAGHIYDVDFQLRPVVGTFVLAVRVIGKNGEPLTETARFDCSTKDDCAAAGTAAAGTAAAGTAAAGTAAAGTAAAGTVTTSTVAASTAAAGTVTTSTVAASTAAASNIATDTAATDNTAANVNVHIEHDTNGWLHCTAQVRGIRTDYGKLHIAIEPGAEPAVELTDKPTAEPTEEPTEKPTAEPNTGPTAEPTEKPTAESTTGPTAKPTAHPTSEPTTEPTTQPAAAANPHITAHGNVLFDLDLVQFMDADYWGAGDPKWRYGKLRRDLVETIKALHPTFMRFPGGCIVEGVTPGNEYRWKDTIGALAARRPQYSIWSFKMPDGSSYCQSYQIGFYEYFCLCEDLGAKPLPTLFAGIACQSPGRDPRHMDIDSEAFRRNVIQDYLDLIEFANGNPNTSPWAAVRRDMGHPEPFGLDMIGVGNENFGADYVAKFTRISDAIHAIYPHMLCIMSAGLFPFQLPMKRTWDYARTVATAGTGALDSATGDAIIVDEHSYHSPEWFESQAHRFDNYPRCGAGVYFGEYSANGYFAGQPQTEQGANTWKSALGEAAFLTGCERNSDVVKMTSYAPLLAHIPAKGWAQNLIEFNPAHVNPTLNYEAERLFSAHVGPFTYQVDVERTATARHLYVSATGGDCSSIGNSSSCRYIKIVNTSAKAVDVTLEIERGLAALGRGTSGNNTVISTGDADNAGRSAISSKAVSSKAVSHSAVSSSTVRLEIETLSAAPTAKTTIGYRGKAEGAIIPEHRALQLPAANSLLAMKIQPYSLTLVTARW
ncbi:alpha-L-arabinofuranosidase C-terminal domain-containing protein [Bifidobacterium colobi]|uniref:alpha-L-arabinofuranosidase C-terminal domain-containing protein n=1 Tax=Bifidobacterium colobi TaxID=2809026 RepID=UPI001F0ADAC5|nr:alpha-L-arabinofuranosidase C-terminal domain-containing protein [Bifidobacterium colobi]